MTESTQSAEAAEYHHNLLTVQWCAQYLASMRAINMIMRPETMAVIQERHEAARHAVYMYEAKQKLAS